jgi:hypothetical protein
VPNKPPGSLPTSDEAKANNVRNWNFVDPSRAVETGTKARLEIKPSLLPGAGLGVFATREIGEGKTLGFYRGAYLTQAQFDQSYRGTDAVYVVSYSKARRVRGGGRADELLHVDGREMFPRVTPNLERHEFNWPRYINHGPRELVNCEFLENGAGTAFGIRVVSIKRIYPSDELFVDYGDDYWGENASGSHAAVSEERKASNEQRKKTEARIHALGAIVRGWPTLYGSGVAPVLLKIVSAYKDKVHDSLPWPPTEEIGAYGAELLNALNIHESWEQRIFIQMLRAKISNFKRTPKWKNDLVNAAAGAP